MLLSRFQEYVRENALLTPQDKVLLTVSGGVDSMVMLSLFVRSGYDVGVAHCNFQLRGRESEEDEVSVAEAAKAYGVPSYNIRFDTVAEMERTGDSMEMAARRLRYNWFAQLCVEYGYTVVATAHHADDSIETFFINLLRGTGLRGLTGISVVNGRIIRPLLFASRREILDYAHANGIGFREDSSNRSTKYLRNKIRLGLVPRIREINPHFTGVMGRNIQHLTEAQLFIDHGIERIREEVESQREGLIVIDPEKIDKAFPESFVIYEILNAYGFKSDVVEALCNSLRQGTSGKRFYSREYVGYTDRGKIILSKIGEEDDCAVTLDAGMDRVYCGNSVLYVERFDIDNIDTLHQPDNVALIDADRLHFPLEVRRWRDGDAFVPLGMTGHKKVSDMLVDLKVPVAEKRRQFVLLNDGEIVWLIGRRIDDRYRITSTTENVLRITREIV